MPTIVVPSSGGGQPGISGGGGGGSTLVDQVAAVVGGVDEDSVRVQALEAVNRARNEINMHDWRFLKRTVTSTAFVSGTATYTLPTIFKSPGFFRVLDSNSKPYRDLIYMDDADLSHAVPQQTLSGCPAAYSLRNTFADGLITFYPVPGTTEASSYTWAGEYYTRIPYINDDSTALTGIPDEIGNVLVAGGQYYLVSEREKGNGNIVSHKWQDYQRIKNLALVNDRRMSDDRGGRFRLPNRRNIVFTNSNDYYGRFP